MSQDVQLSPFVVKGVPYFVESVWTENAVAVTVTDGERVWRGSASITDITETIRRSGVQEVIYLQRMKEALGQQDLTGARATYDFAIDESGLILRWNIQCGPTGPAGSFSVQGSMKLFPESDSKAASLSLLDRLLAQNKSLRLTNEKLSQENKVLAHQRADAVLMASRAVEEKQQMEAAMLSKFVAVLNEKKRYIRELELGIANGTNAPSHIKELAHAGASLQALHPQQVPVAQPDPASVETATATNTRVRPRPRSISRSPTRTPSPPRPTVAATLPDPVLQHQHSSLEQQPSGRYSTRSRVSESLPSVEASQSVERRPRKRANKVSDMPSVSQSVGDMMTTRSKSAVSANDLLSDL